MEVEGTILQYKYAEMLHAETGACRWDLFCSDRAFLMGKIKEIQELLTSVSSMTARIEQKPAMRGLIEPKLMAAKKRLAEVYGIKV